MNEKPQSMSEELYREWELFQGQGEIAKALGELPDAGIQFQRAALTLAGEQSVEARLFRAHSLVSVGLVFLMLEQPDLAFDAFLKARILREGLIPAEHSLTAELHHQIANTYRALGQYDQAHEHYHTAWWCLVTILPKTHEYVISVARNWLHSNVAWETVKRKSGGST
jgi:tetratricopeptide (TPR) repeat protein